ncbi:MAG: S8 family serine peptidase [Chloracidobacterium sp.]|nr:S8 family serine peptidase [Chloracidobacterium sp.]
MKSLRRFLAVCCICSALFNYAASQMFSFALATNNRDGFVAQPSTPGVNKLRKHDRARLAECLAEGKKEATLLIVSKPGAVEDVVGKLYSLGCVVKYRDDDVGYLRVNAPIEHAEQVAALNDIEAINVDGIFAYHTSLPNEIAPQQNADGLSPERIHPPGPDTPAENPYLPVRDMGAPQFIAKNPTFDGRGVVIGDIDAYPDILHPALQSATTLDGQPARKIIDVVGAFDPTIDDESPFLAQMVDEVTAAGGRFVYKGARFTAPADGDYRIGSLDSKKASLFGVKGELVALWDEKTNRVWVDTNQDRSFADEKAMTDYAASFDVGLIRKDDPATPQRGPLAFTVQTFPGAKAVCLGRMSADHGTATASAAAAKGLFGGQMNGAAPGAQIVMVGGNTNMLHGGIEAFILAVKHPKVDVVTAQFGIHLGLNDGSSVMSQVCDRLVEKYKKPIFVSAGNSGPGVNRVNEFGNGQRVMSVGSYVHRDTWRAIYGAYAPKDEYAVTISARGPRHDGGFKPDILAPSAGIYPSPGNRSGESLTDAYKLPPGYAARGAGTSFAAPMAAGAAALLISAARQSGVQYDVDRLYWAMKASARFLPGFGAHEQGNGIINVPAAWEALRKAAAPVIITSQAPISATLSRYLTRPNEGVGIYEREGWFAGQADRRVITLMRASGGEMPVTYSLKWLGNDGAFSSQERITLPLNTPVPVPVTVNPRTKGVHSAILSLISPEGSMVYQALNTVIAAEQFTADNAFKVEHEGEVEWLGYNSFFINVPIGASAFKIDLQITSGNLLMNIHDPTHETYGNRPIRPGYESGLVFYQTGGNASKTIMNPEPGVWEIVIVNDNDRDKKIYSTTRKSASFRLTASVFSVEVTPSEVSIEHASADTVQTVNVGLRNRLGTFAGRITDTPLGSGMTDRPTLSPGNPRVYEIDIPPGTQALTARVSNASDGKADLDLYLFDCTGGNCEVRGFGHEDGARETVYYPAPDPGKWKVVIDPVKVPSGKVSVDFEDIFTHPVFGRIESSGVSAAHNSGQKWTDKIAVEVNAAPVGNRQLVGIIEVVGEEITLNPAHKIYDLARPDRPGALRVDERRSIALGSALVRISNVSPSKISKLPGQ